MKSSTIPWASERQCFGTEGITRANFEKTHRIIVNKKARRSKKETVSMSYEDDLVQC